MPYLPQGSVGRGMAKPWAGSAVFDFDKTLEGRRAVRFGETCTLPLPLRPTAVALGDCDLPLAANTLARLYVPPSAAGLVVLTFDDGLCSVSVTADGRHLWAECDDGNHNAAAAIPANRWAHLQWTVDEEGHLVVAGLRLPAPWNGWPKRARLGPAEGVLLGTADAWPECGPRAPTPAGYEGAVQTADGLVLMTGPNGPDTRVVVPVNTLALELCYGELVPI